MADSHFTFSGKVRPICQVGMSTTRTAEPTSWLDVSCFVHECELFRGRERFTDRFQPGTASITFSNETGWGDLVGSPSIVAGQTLRPGRPIRVGVHGPWTLGQAPFTRWLYRGFIDQAAPAYDPVLHDVVTVNCIDALGESGSATAPTGDFQGVNETVSARLNRVLNAVGWWSSKRKIAATPTTVQGTSLGSAAIDLMGQAADSAGGVVYGDLVGDVVFKPIDWMLYDPDVPPDDEIGNMDPGEPGLPPDGPPHVDPTPGPVHDPDDPPAEHPPKVCVCADGTAGTLIEKGDNYRLYVKDGHLFYESGGHTWDLGPYSGGCTCVEPPSGGGGGGGAVIPPERTDDPEGDGTYVPNPLPPLEIAPVFGVELLAWNDGGLADPAATEVVVPGIAPGNDCLLAVLVNALGSDTNLSGLAPSFDGAGLDWAHRRDADRLGPVASSYIALAPVGRTDPGTFDVTVTWAPPSTSRGHIVTVWKIVAAAGDYLARFDAGSVMYAATASNPPELILPGDGPYTVELFADRQPAGLEVLTRVVDITIAQSLAEEGTGPFGAILADADGPWTIPPNEPPMPVARAVTPTFSDDFERADGALGANWPAPTAYPAGPRPDITPTISSGAAVATAAGDALAYYAVAVPGDHYIEVEVAGWHQIGTSPTRAVQITLMTRWAGPATFTCAATRWTMSAAQDGGLLRNGSYTAGTGALVTSNFIAPADTFRLRLESTVAGHHTILVDDIVADEFDDTTGTGDYVGFWMFWDTAGTSPRILSAEVGTVGVERAISWIAGWRVGAASHTAMLDDVNTGVDDLQSAQACLVVESAETEAGGWRVVDYDLRASPTGVTAAGAMTLDNPPRPGSLIALFVGATAGSDLIDSVTVTGVDVTRVHVQHPAAPSWGQGAIYTAKVPLDMTPGSWAIVVGHPEVESISTVVYEITTPDETSPVGGVGSGVLGTNAAGSVDGTSTITMSAAGDPTIGVAFAYLHVATAEPSTTSGAASVDGDEWHEEFQYSPAIHAAYLQTMSRAPGQVESTSTSVTWDDVQTGTTLTFSGVQLAVEIRLDVGFPFTPSADPVALGGVTDAFNGPITSAGGFDPITGLPIWEFP